MPAELTPDLGFVPEELAETVDRNEQVKGFLLTERRKMNKNFVDLYAQQFEGYEGTGMEIPGAEGIKAAWEFATDPLSGGLRRGIGTEQLGRELAPQYQELEILSNRLQTGDESVRPRVQELEDEINAYQWASTPEQASRRSPDVGRAEAAATYGQAPLASIIAPSLSSGVVRNVGATVVDPAGQVFAGGLEALGRGAQALHEGEEGAIRLSGLLPSEWADVIRSGGEAAVRKLFGKGGERVPAEAERAAAQVPAQEAPPPVAPRGLPEEPTAPPGGAPQPTAATGTIPAAPSPAAPGAGAPGVAPAAPKPPPGDMAPLGDLFNDASDDVKDYIRNTQPHYYQQVKQEISNPTTKARAVAKMGLVDELAREVMARPDGEPAENIYRLAAGVLQSEEEYRAAENALLIAHKMGDPEAETYAQTMIQAGIRNFEFRMLATRKMGTEGGRLLQATKMVVSYGDARSAAQEARNAATLVDDLARRVSKSGGQVDEELLSQWEGIKAWFDANEARVAKWEELGLLGTKLPEPPPGPIAGGAQDPAARAAARAAADAARTARLDAAVRNVATTSGSRRVVAEIVGRGESMPSHPRIPRQVRPGDPITVEGPKDKRRQEFLELSRQRSASIETGYPPRSDVGNIEQRMDEILDEWKDEYRAALAKRKPRDPIKFATAEDAQRWWDKQFMDETQRLLREEVRRERPGEKMLGGVYDAIDKAFRRNWENEMARELRLDLNKIDRFIKAGGDRQMARAAIDEIRRMGTRANQIADEYERGSAKRIGLSRVGSEEWDRLPQEQKDELMAAMISPEFWLNPRAGNALVVALSKPSNWDKAFTMRLANMMAWPGTQVINLGGGVGETLRAVPLRVAAGLGERVAPVEKGRRNATEMMAVDEIQGWGNSAAETLRQGIWTLATGVSARNLREANTYGTDIVPRSMPLAFGMIFGGAQGYGQVPAEASQQEKMEGIVKGAAVGGLGGLAYGSKIPLSGRAFDQLLRPVGRPPGVRATGVSPANLVFRVMGASDDMIRTLNTSGAIMAETRREALRTGKSIQEIMLNLTKHPEVMERATKQTSARTYTEELGVITKLVQSARATNPGIQSMIPFWQTIVNMANQGWRMTPAVPGLLKGKIDPFGDKATVAKVREIEASIPKLQARIKQARDAGDTIKVSQREMDLAGAQRRLEREQQKAPYAEAADRRGAAMFGTLALGVAGWQAAQGNITGFGPTDPEDRKLWLSQGNRPYSIKVGDEWRSYTQWGSLIVPLGIAASVVEAWQEGERRGDKEMPDRIAHGLTAAVRSFGYLWLNVLALKGVADTVNAIQDPERYGSMLVTSLVATYRPAHSFLAGLSRMFDAEVKDPEGFVEELKAKTPWLSEEVKPRLTQLGEPMERAMSGAGALLPIQSTKVKPSPILQEYQRLRGVGQKVTVGTVGTSLEGVKLTDAEQTEYQRRYGELMRERLPSVLSGAKYQAMSDYKRALYLDDVERILRERAAAALIKEYIGREKFNERMRAIRQQQKVGAR